MNKFILLSFLLTVLAANTDATVTPFSCYYTAQGAGTTAAAVLSAPNCVTACYRVTATGGIPLGKNVIGSNNPANSINGVITTLVSTSGGNLDTAARQKTNVIGVGVPSQIGVLPNSAGGTATTDGVQTLGNIGIITLPPATPENGLNDFVLNDRGCLPILALQTTPQGLVIRADTDSNQIPYTIGRTCTGVNNPATGQCGTLPTCNFGSTTSGCLIGSAKAAAAPGVVIGNGRNEPSGTSGTVVVTLGSTNTLTTHVKQQIPTAESTGGIPLQLAYNPIIGGSSATVAIATPVGSDGTAPGSIPLNWPNLLANSQVNQAALDLAAVTTLFCVTSGVCCTSNACNTIPVVTTKSSSTSLNNNIIIILMSIICSMSF